MACMGPSKDFAFARGEEAHELIVDFLKEKYQAERPDIMSGVINGKKVEYGFGRRDQKEWDEQSEQLKLLLQEMIWNSDASSF